MDRLEVLYDNYQYDMTMHNLFLIEIVKEKMWDDIITSDMVGSMPLGEKCKLSFF